MIVFGNCSVFIDSMSVVVKPDVADKQVVEDNSKSDEYSGTQPRDIDAKPSSNIQESNNTTTHKPAEPELPRVFFGSVILDADRIGREAGKVAEEVLQHLGTLPGAKVTVSLEIHAQVPDGVSEELQRVIAENCEVLKFKAHGFDKN